MKSVKTDSNAPEYAQLLGEFDRAKSAYKQAKTLEIAAKHQLKDSDKKGNEDVLRLRLKVAKHNRKALKSIVKITKLAIKNWIKAHQTEASIEVTNVPKQKKRGRQPKSVESGEKPATETPAPKKRGRQPKADKVVVEKSESKKRGRQPKAVEVAVETTTIVDAEAPAPKKRGRQPKATIVATEKAASKKRGRQSKSVEDEEEGVAGASARAMMAEPIVKEKAPKVAKIKAVKVVKTAKVAAPKVVKEKAPKAVKVVKEKAPKAVKVVKEKAPKVVKVAAPKIVKEKAPKVVKVAAPKVKKVSAPAVVSGGDDLKIIEGIGPKVASILIENGITTFQQLAGKGYDELKALMINNKQFLANPTNWARQSQLAADGKMAELDALKATLKNGK
jgi:large subunit ribosomal protein L21